MFVKLVIQIMKLSSDNIVRIRFEKKLVFKLIRRELKPVKSEKKSGTNTGLDDEKRFLLKETFAIVPSQM